MSTQTQVSHKQIPLDAVRHALMCAVIKKKSKGHELSGKPLARTAAFTNYPSWLMACRDAKRRPYLRQQVQLVKSFGLMERGDMQLLANEVRLSKGLREVRKTWGCGIKALIAETKGAMR